CQRPAHSQSAVGSHRPAALQTAARRSSLSDCDQRWPASFPWVDASSITTFECDAFAVAATPAHTAPADNDQTSNLRWPPTPPGLRAASQTPAGAMCARLWSAPALLHAPLLSHLLG